MSAPAVVLGLVVLGIALFLVSTWLRGRSGIPPGVLAYSDTDVPAQPLVAPRYRLVGKPDYIVIHRGSAIPVEVKPSRTAPAPYESDRIQLAAYCLLLEEVMGKRPPFAVLRYQNATYRVDYTTQARGRVLRLLAEMRSRLDADDVPRSHHSASRCASCGFRGSCEQSLAK